MENGGRIMNTEALRDLSYGMFVVTTKKDKKNVGCFINTVMQITSISQKKAIMVEAQLILNSPVGLVKKL